MQILVVEDDGIIAKHIGNSLKKLGYSLQGILASGEDAVVEVKRQPPDLILMDIALQGEMDGIDAAARIREFADIPLIYLTAYADDTTLARAKVTDPFGYILKPFEERYLRTNIEMAYNKHQLEKRLRESEERFRTLVQNQSEGVIITDPDENVTFANPAAETIFGIEAGCFVGQNMREFMSPEQYAFAQEQTRKRRFGEKSTYGVEIHRTSGELRHLMVTGTPWFDRDRLFAGSFVIFRDITEQIIAEHSEKEQRALAEALRDTTAALVSTLDINEVFDRILSNVGKVVPHDSANVMLIENGSARVVQGRGYYKRGLDEVVLAIRPVVKNVPLFQLMIETGKPVCVPDTRKEPEWRDFITSTWVRSYIGAPIQIKNTTVGFLNLDSSRPSFFKPIHADRLKAFADQAAIAIENARLYADVQQMALTDELTGYYNRRGLFELGQREVNRAQRFNRPLSIIWIDFDNFKQINDTYGHDIGDEVLRQGVDRAQESIREIDLFGRYGGDEFVVLLPETDLKAASQVAERIRQVISEVPANTSKGEIFTSVSLGVSVLNRDMVDLTSLLNRADQAMYDAKQAGKNRVSSQ